MKLTIIKIFILTSLFISCKSEDKSKEIIDNTITKYQNIEDKHQVFTDIVTILNNLDSSENLNYKKVKDTAVISNTQTKLTFVKDQLKVINTKTSHYNIKNDKDINIVFKNDKTLKEGRLKNGIYTGFYRAHDELGYQELELNNGDTLSYFSYYNNGEPRKTINYSHGKRDGNYVEYYKNGTKAKEEQYNKGNNEGLAMTWFDNGKLKSKVNYVAGKKEGEEVVFYKNANSMASKSIYKNGKRHGKQLAWYKNLSVKHKVDFKEGKLNGEMILYQENKKLMKMKGNYLNDLKNGGFLMWNEDGKILFSATYELGELIQIIKGKEELQYQVDELESNFF